MKKADLGKKSEKDLVKELLEKRKALRDFKFSMWGSKTRNTKEGQGLKKEIARSMTEMRSRELSK
jgi:ribosomal protein L29